MTNLVKSINSLTYNANLGLWEVIVSVEHERTVKATEPFVKEIYISQKALLGGSSSYLDNYFNSNSEFSRVALPEDFSEIPTKSQLKATISSHFRSDFSAIKTGWNQTSINAGSEEEVKDHLPIDGYWLYRDSSMTSKHVTFEAGLHVRNSINAVLDSYAKEYKVSAIIPEVDPLSVKVVRVYPDRPITTSNSKVTGLLAGDLVTFKVTGGSSSLDYTVSSGLGQITTVEREGSTFLRVSSNSTSTNTFTVKDNESNETSSLVLESEEKGLLL